MQKVLILGRSGQVAQALATRFAADFDVVSLGRAELDLADARKARAAVLEIRPDVVINAAAYTAVDRAESEAEAALALNATGPAAAAAAATEIGAPFVHYSTDYVFDGSKGSPYLETDAPSPLGVYGRTKLDGERAIAEANPRHVILRTSWVCSPGGANFLRTMLRLAGERDELGVVDDQRGSPTFAADLADAAAGVLAAIAADEQPEHFGVFHATGRGDTTWCGFAQAIMEASATRGGPSCRIKAITSADYPTPVKRPADSRLDCTKLETVFGLALPDWRTGLAACLDTIHSNQTISGASR